MGDLNGVANSALSSKNCIGHHFQTYVIIIGITISKKTAPLEYKLSLQTLLLPSVSLNMQESLVRLIRRPLNF